MRTKTCDNEHPAITFSYISELEECPVCKILGGHEDAIEELKEEHEKEMEASYVEYEATTTRITKEYEEKIEQHKDLLIIAHQEITRLKGE